ncbi:MAG: hypothetical protein AB7G12_12805 [Thermoanaerobaculia bacterium]
MGVISVERRWQRRRGSFANPAEQDDDIHYLVRVNNKYDTAVTIRNSGMLPAWLSPHPEDPTMTRRDLSIDPLPETPLAWEAIAHYSSAPIEDIESEINPLLRPMKVRISAHETERYTIVDREDRQMTTSAGEPFDPIVIDDTRFLIECELNVAAIPSWFLSGKNRTNSNQFAINFVGGPKQFAVDTCQFKPVGMTETISVEIDGVGTVNYATLRFNLDFREETWDYQPEDKGFWFIHSNGDVYHIVWKDEFGQWHKVDQPQYLDGSGGLLVGVNEEVDPDEIVRLRFGVHKQMNFGAIPFP